MSLSDPGIVNGFRDKFEKIESYGIDMVFGNDDEAQAFSGESELDKAIDYLIQKSFISLITRDRDPRAALLLMKIIAILCQELILNH